MKTAASNTISAQGYAAGELMVAAAAREIHEAEIVFVGMRLPMLAFAVAKRTHAPGAIGLFENGVIRETPSSELLYTMADPPNLRAATLAGTMLDVMGFLQQGKVHVGFLGAAEVDRFGNLNTTLVRGERGATRLPGSGGACDIACVAQRTAVLLEHSKRRLVERVNYITSPGNGDGNVPGKGSWRTAQGLPARSGPAAIITTLGVLRFDADNGEAFLASVHPGTQLEDVLSNTGWPLRVSANLAETAPPTAEELGTMRGLDPEGFWTGL
jgi:glutaconate CoA-transferase subunit B